MIIKAVERAYKVMDERKWDTVYWAVDLHGVCLKSNYTSGDYQWLNGDVPRVLKLLSDRPETKIILWSSVYSEEKSDIIGFFYDHGIQVWDFNRNDHEPNTILSCFEEKFYFSVLLDDKAGFDPDTDWLAIEGFFQNR